MEVEFGQVVQKNIGGMPREFGGGGDSAGNGNRLESICSRRLNIIGMIAYERNAASRSNQFLIVRPAKSDASELRARGAILGETS